MLGAQLKGCMMQRQLKRATACRLDGGAEVDGALSIISDLRASVHSTSHAWRDVTPTPAKHNPRDTVLTCCFGSVHEVPTPTRPVQP
jgi:hypothetical protein